jgi:chloramphenicol-sensitive protein RarD
MKKGTLFVFVSYVLWGFFPIYFKTLHLVSAFQIVAHRFIWSFLFLLLLVAIRRELGALKTAIKPRILLIYLGAGTVLAINWLTYIWSVNNGYLVEASLGYFINPLVSVLLGIIFLREKLRPAQWVPVGIAAAGVVYLTVSYGGLPWVSLVLAVSFGLYGLIKKTAPLGSLYGLTIETAMLILPAFGFLLFSEANGTGNFGHMGIIISLLLVFTGVVTAIPLLLFASGTREVPLSTVGLLQYISPTLQFLTGVFIFHEAFSRDHLIGFSIIWLALVIFSAESLISRRRSAAGVEPTVISS